MQATNEATDLETCSLCTHEVRDSTLIEVDAGRVCTECIQQHLRDANLPCLGCGQRWEGPRQDCMDHLDDCAYTKWQDEQEAADREDDWEYDAMNSAPDRAAELNYWCNSSSVTGIIQGP